MKVRYYIKLFSDLSIFLWNYFHTYPYVLVVICGLLEIITTCSEVVTNKIYVKSNTKSIYFSIMYQITTFLQAVTGATICTSIILLCTPKN